MKVENKQDVLNSLIIPSRQQGKLTIAKNEQTGPSNETKASGWPMKFESMGEKGTILTIKCNKTNLSS